MPGMAGRVLSSAKRTQRSPEILQWVMVMLNPIPRFVRLHSDEAVFPEDHDLMTCALNELANMILDGRLRSQTLLSAVSHLNVVLGSSTLAQRHEAKMRHEPDRCSSPYGNLTWPSNPFNNLGRNYDPSSGQSMITFIKTRVHALPGLL